MFHRSRHLSLHLFSEIFLAIIFFVVVEKVLSVTQIQVFLDSPYDGERLTLFLSIVVGLALWWHLFSDRRVDLMPFWETMAQSLKSIVIAFFLDTMGLFLLHQSQSRMHWLLTWLLIVMWLPLLRYQQIRHQKKIQARQPTFYVGSGKHLLEALRALADDRLLGYHASGVYSLTEPSPELVDYCSKKSITLRTGSLEQLQKPNFISRLVLAFDEANSEQLSSWMAQCRQWSKNLVIAPTLSTQMGVVAQPHYILGYDVAIEADLNRLASPVAQATKRAFDVIGSLILIVIFALPCTLIALIIRLGGGPALFRQERVGYLGQHFVCWKFRSMVVNADQILQETLNNPEDRAYWETYLKLPKDPRITKIGHWLRRTSLDELPQLWNVLKGDMSLVGPRPMLPSEVYRWGSSIGYYEETRPGITGLWQVSGRNHLDYEKRVSLDTWYVKNWSLWIDVVILIKTLKVVVRSDGAY